MDTTNIKDAQGEIRENIITMFGIHKLPEGEQEEAINRLGKIIFPGFLQIVTEESESFRIESAKVLDSLK
ncbi:MAG: hypothetical protein UU24_C0041G0008 [Candidatus Nomurabacteria bacterium GW2011_GWA2_40_9]|uniref:Uncharacterized protein n=1 Tax=Candidatus Nomurabacteria bacterium GW2011_GWA2_40_9 TaxID=1618734 RepID=A0A0G0WS23_9BACT|nr:MAG: hypothetical protein UU24_C0041G0008 [Candidatus Nomurabacteria bacterium GW2011_GWA2_40_9]